MQLRIYPSHIMSSYSAPFIKILEILASAHHYTIRTSYWNSSTHDAMISYEQLAAGRSLRHGRMLEKLVKGKTAVGVGEVLRGLHGVAEVFLQVEDRGLLGRPDSLYHSLNHAFAALTCYAAQKVGDHL